MKKSLKVFSVIIFLIGMIQPVLAEATEIPIVDSFTMSPDSLDISSANAIVTFQLVVENPDGIFSQQTNVTLTDGANNSVFVPIVRTDSPINPKLTKVEFRGSYTIASNLPSGVYTASTAGIYGATSTGGQGYSTGAISATSNSKLAGASNSLLIRNGGYLNFAYGTFVGPAFNKSIGISYNDSKFNNVSAPIWKVGETFNPADYYEVRGTGVSLKLKSNSTATCLVNGSKLKLIAVGNCEFVVYTDKTIDYAYRQDVQSVTISAARTKPTLYLGTIATQTSNSLPKSIQGPFVYSPLGLVIPITTTPTVCSPVGSYISIISGGTCTLHYSTPATSEYQASDVYILTFEITRNTQTLTFSLPATVSLTAGTVNLTATASSGLPVTFESKSPSICDVQANSLRLKKAGSCQVSAVQAGSTTIAPISAVQTIAVTSPVASKKIICIKNGKVKTFLSKKCPTGYKQKK